jgi:predicted type IV restriction endonuclease
MLSEVFGYDKYSEVTSETAIRGTYCDLAVKLNGSIAFLVEAKAIGQDLKDAYLKQAVDYAANQGIDWVVLTNGILWRIYKVVFSKPIDQELIAEVNFSALDPKEEDHLSHLFLLSKEGWMKTALSEYFDQKQALSRFCMAAVVLSEPLLKAIRKQLKVLSPDVKIDLEQIKHVLEQEVFKREVVEGEKAQEACKRLAKLLAKAAKANAKEGETETIPHSPAVPAATIVAPPPPITSPPAPPA